MCEGKACPAMQNAVRSFSVNTNRLSLHHRTLLAGLLAEHIAKNFNTPKVLHVDLPKNTQERYLEARTHAYADAIGLYQDLGGARVWPDKPSRVTFSALDPADLRGYPVVTGNPGG